MFQGSMVALVTPMHEDGSLDRAALAKLVEFHVENGTNAIVAMGTTGESATLDTAEHCAVVRLVVELAAGRIPIIAGTGSNSTQEAIELTRCAKEAGVANAFDIPGFVPEFIRPLFCEGAGPFRWCAISGDPADIAATDRVILDLFPDNEHLVRWIKLAAEKVAFQGLPCRICWLSYGERAKAGLAFNELVRTGKVSAPIVIGRDHLDCGSVASPNRETEGMKDGSDAIADWPILNALVNTACGASWVSVHHGGGVGMGLAIHAGMVCLADGTDEAAQRLERVLTADPATGVIRHVDAGYEKAEQIAKDRGVKIPR